MRRLLEMFLLKLAAQRKFQAVLARNVIFSHRLMGIGAGGEPASSGEKMVLEMLLDRCCAGRPLCIFDVGSNCGQFVELVQQSLRGVAVELHCFEPSKKAFELLSTKVGNHSGIHLNNLALGSRCCNAPLFSDKPGSGLASLYRRKMDHFGIDFSCSEKVDVSTLDDYCGKCDIGAIDLLKLDVEGHEYDVLQGGLRLFREGRVRTVTFEFGGCNLDSRTYFRDFHYFFRENRMSRIFRIVPAGCLVPIDQYRELHEQFQTTNFLALSDAL